LTKESTHNQFNNVGAKLHVLWQNQPPVRKTTLPLAGTGFFVTPKWGRWTNLPPVPKGKVKFMEGNRVLGEATFNQFGTALFRPAKLSLGGHTIRAVYDGDGQFGSNSGEIDLWVAKTQTTTLLSAAGNPVKPGGAIRLMAQVRTEVGDYAKPGGWLELWEGKKKLARLPMGQLSVMSLKLAPGLHTIMAKYLGDGDSLPSTSNVLAITVLKRK
jgi:hypothetical protein